MLPVSAVIFDPLNRRVRADYGDGSGTAFAYDTVGRLKQAEDSTSGRIEFSYDNLDRLTQELTPQGTVQYQYDSITRLTNMTVNGQTPVSYQYDSASRLTQVAQGTQVVGLEYDAAGRRTSLAHPNGVNTTYTYDTAARLTNILHQGPSSIIEDLTYTYDAAGNRVSLTRPSGASTVLPGPVQAAYDTANEQIQFNNPTPNLTYDANGNLISHTDASGTTTYTWDARNRLTGINGPGVSTSFVYDALGRRVIKTNNGVITRYHYDQDDIVGETTNGTVGITYFRNFRIDEPFIRNSSESSYYHTGSLGSTLALTNQAGSVETTYHYDSFGTTNILGTNPNVFQFSGRENDEVGLYYYRARYYSPYLHRFLSEDPIEFAGGSVNLYTYVRNNPTNLTDPTGLLFSGRINAGELFGEVAAQDWADLYVENGNPWYANPYFIPGILASLWTRKTSDLTLTTLTIAYSAGAYVGRSFWQYYPAGNPSYTSPWLTRGWGWRPPYTPGQQAVQKLALPHYNPGTAIRAVKPPPW